MNVLTVREKVMQSEHHHTYYMCNKILGRWVVIGGEREKSALVLDLVILMASWKLEIDLFK